ncbi:MAG: hypothetical protein R3A80_00540 [Bdellovibrionota bacterium]
MRRSLFLNMLLGIFLFLFIFTSKAEASKCKNALYLYPEYQELVDIAEKNSRSRDKFMRSSKEAREARLEEYLLDALMYEKKKIHIYIAMLEKSLTTERGAFIRTSQEIRRRLLRSFDAYADLQSSLAEIEGFFPTPLEAPMSKTVSDFLRDE